MKEVNLISLTQIFENLENDVFENYSSLYGIKKPKIKEVEDLVSLVEELRMRCKYMVAFDNYFFNYSIPQISKEFDLLRFGEDTVLNIELKNRNTGERITKQLKENRYYLSFLDKEIASYTYVSSEKKLYTLDKNEELIESDFDELIKFLADQESLYSTNIDSLFNPSDYLVSPFNSTEQFIEGQYFLTDHQRRIKREIEKSILDGGASFFSISGKAGTGKTLLTYDFAKSKYESGVATAIVHCGKLNSGHYQLREDYGWDIIPIRDYYTALSSTEYSLIIIDEAQRINPSQLEWIISRIKSLNGIGIFSYDRRQCLKNDEVNNNIENLIEKEANPQKHELTDKIRTNAEIASFIRALFDKSKKVSNIGTSNIELNYFDSVEDAKKFVRFQSAIGWKVINYTPDRHRNLHYEHNNVPNEDNAHEIIGQEFDQVVAVIDPYFGYIKNRLTIKGYTKTPFYHPVLMLFQILTRTRKKLSIVIINNPEIFKRCIALLK